MGGMLKLALWFASGNAFFAGAALLIAAAVVKIISRRKAGAVAARMAALMGAILVALSATPLPVWFYALWAASVAWFLFEPDRRPPLPRDAHFAAAAVVVVTLIAAAWELPYQFTPRVDAAGAKVVVIGDSISAGVNDDIPIWPAVLRARSGRDVIDLSEAGLTMARALPKTLSLPAGGSVVILEIGGNDMLEQISARRFETDLDRLLAAVSKPGNRVVLMELPLPMFFNRYGVIQRKLAAKYHATLIPRRRFAGVLAYSGGTIDGLHLSAKGHQLMAELFEEVLQGR